MTRVYLIRHAAAETHQPLGDQHRALTEAGRAQWVAHVLELARELNMQRILCSPFLRTRQTAEILAQQGGIPLAVLTELASGQLAGAQLLALARHHGPGTAVVGHNPEVAEAVAQVHGSGLAVPPGTVAAIQWDAGTARLLWCRSPR